MISVRSTRRAVKTQENYAHGKKPLVVAGVIL